MLCSLPSAYLTLLGFALLSTVTPKSSHRLLITDVFKHWPMSSTWRWLDTPSRVSFHVVHLSYPRSFTCRISETAWLQQTAAERPKFCCCESNCCCCCWRPTGLLLLLLRSQSTNFMRLLSVDSLTTRQAYYGSRPKCKTEESTSAQVLLLLAGKPVYCCCCAQC